MTPKRFVSMLRAASFEDVFNPYADRCPVHDLPDASKARARTLVFLLAAAAQVEIDSLWLGRDLGWRGGRRTGLAFTDDVHFSTHLARFGLTGARPTKGEAIAERTAAIVWSPLAKIEARIFLWNVFPLHPHRPDEPFSNRAHNVRERAFGEEILSELLSMLRPKRLVAIGAQAANAAARLGPPLEFLRARHPSFGGHREFLAQAEALYAIGGSRRAHPQ